LSEKVKPRKNPDPDECPFCGATHGDSFDMGHIFIDLQTGFVALKTECECGKVVERFYDWDRTEEASE